MASKSMTQNEIEEKYELFKIPKHLIPQYTNAEESAKNYVECTLLLDTTISYSTSTERLSKKVQ